jgi:hypothetical protein
VRRSTLIRLAMVPVALAACWAGRWRLVDATGMCVNRDVWTVPAPQGGREAAVFTRDCGATTGWATMVQVRGPLRLGRPAGPGDAFSASWDRARRDLPRVGGGPPIVVEWTSAERLRVTVDDRARSWHAPTPVGGVTVETRTRRLADGTGRRPLAP